jgi:RNA polymerase sigma-70 factor (ECF subfamily)
METPVSLLQRLRQSADQEAWSRLVQLYFPLVCYWARRAGLQDADVADLAQEVFLVLFRTLPDFTYDKHKSFRNWLCTVTLNKWRELGRRRAVPVVRAGSGLDDVAAPDCTSVWDEEHNRYLVAKALELMQADFATRTWRACWGTLVEGRTPAEVARQLGTTVAAVYTARARVLRRLRQELEGLL